MNKLLDKNYWLYLVDRLMKKPNVDNGFIDYQPYGSDEIYHRGKQEILGNRKIELNPSGDWREYRPTGEAQKRDGSETMSCVAQSACNAIEQLINYILRRVEQGQASDNEKNIVNVFKGFDIIVQNENGVWEANASDRYVAKMSNTTYRGNTQKNVANAIRKYGLVAENDWGWVSGWNNYYSPILDSVISKGEKLTEYIEFNYEWSNPALAKTALKYAPLQTSVYAWGARNGNGAYVRVGNQRNHATIRDAVKSYWHIFDSYNPFAKRATKEFNFGWDMLYTITLKKPYEYFNSTLINELKGRGIKFVMRTDKINGGKGQIYKLADNKLVELDSSDKIQEAVKTLADKDDLTGISENYYLQLINKA